MITPLSKIIDLTFNLNETSKTLLARAATDKQFNTADTDAWFEFGFTDANIQSGTYNLTLINLSDESKFEHEGIAFTSNPFHYKLDSGTDMLTNEIKHAGAWIGQLVVTLSNGNSATQKFVFEIDSHILDGTVASVTMLEGYTTLITQINAAKELLDQYNIDYAALLADLEATYNSRLFSVETQLEHIEPQIAVADNFIKSQFKASDTNLLTQMQSFVDYVNASLNPLVPLVVGDLVNYFVTATIDGSANLLLTKTGAEAFTWSLINKTQINAECTFKITNNRTYFVIAGNTTKAAAVSLAGGIADFGQIMRWKSNGTSENIKSPFADQTGKGLIGDTVKVSRIVTGWKFQIKRAASSVFVDWFDVAFAQAGTNLGTEFTEAEKQYGVVKYSATASENMISTITFKNLFILPNITPFSGKTWNAIGDSITWLNQYEPIVQSGLGLASYNNYGKSGYSTLMLKSDEATWSLSADVITFFAGTNDFGRCDTLATTQSSVSHIFNYLKTNFPNKTIVVVLPTQRWGYTGDTVKGPQPTMTNSDGITLRQYCDTIKAEAELQGFGVLDLYYLSGITKDNINDYTTDGLHPNAAGMQLIANVWIDYMLAL